MQGNKHKIVEGMLVDLCGMDPDHPEYRHYTKGIVTRVYIPTWADALDGYPVYYASVCWPTSRGGTHHYRVRSQLVPSKDTHTDG